MSNQRPLSGAAKLRISGRKAIMITVTPAEKKAILQAAKAEGRKMAQFIKFHSLRLARVLNNQDSVAMARKKKGVN